MISLDFQTISYGDFESEEKICCCVFKRDIDIRIRYTRRYQKYFVTFGGWKREECNLISAVSYVVAVVQNFRKPLVLIIDEVDTATNNQVFVDFLAQLRAYYLRRMQMPTFRSVILAGVYDVRNVKSKIRPEENHKMNNRGI